MYLLCEYSITISFHFLFDSPTICEVASRPQLCELKPKVGPCRAGHLMYYFDQNTKACEEFIYGGCLGNDNRFSSISECEKVCQGILT